MISYSLFLLYLSNLLFISYSYHFHVQNTTTHFHFCCSLCLKFNGSILQIHYQNSSQYIDLIVILNQSKYCTKTIQCYYCITSLFQDHFTCCVHYMLCFIHKCSDFCWEQTHHKLMQIRTLCAFSKSHNIHIYKDYNCFLMLYQA